MDHAQSPLCGKDKRAALGFFRRYVGSYDASMIKLRAGSRQRHADLLFDTRMRSRPLAFIGDAEFDAILGPCGAPVWPMERTLEYRRRQ